jgi:hypothetical protein
MPMKNYQNLKLIVNHDYASFNVSIYGQVIDGTRLFIIGAEDGRIVEQEVTAENELALKTFKPLLTMSEFIFNSFLKAVVEYANNVPIKTRDESLIEGKLLATEKHLEDMREFSKKLLESIIKTTRNENN